MGQGQDAFLNTVRQAVRAGNHGHDAPPLPERGRVGWQGAGPDPVARFLEELARAGGQGHRAATPRQAVTRVVELALGRGARNVVLGRSPWLDGLGLEAALTGAGLTVWAEPEAVDRAAAKATLFAADLGVTAADALVAETGSVIVTSRPGQARSLSLLPPVHVVVAHRGQIVADLFDWFAAVRPEDLPACAAIITGPSKTGDIELRLVTGVHGPGEVHVVLVEAD
jgi:L-lactate utilization protein LutC